MHPSSLECLSNDALVSSLATLRAKQRADDVEFLWFLAEVDRRECYVPRGFASLWEFCREELRMTGGTAGRRIHAARLLKRFPAAAPYLADGRLSLATFIALKDLLTEENQLHLLDAASLKTEDDVRTLVATYLPLSVARTVTIRHMPAKVLELALPEALPSAPQAPEPTATTASPAEVTAVLPPPPPTVKVLSGDYASITLRVPHEFLTLLDQTIDALSHTIPSGDKVAVLTACMKHLLDHREKKHHGLPARAEPPPTPNLGATAPAEPTPNLGATAPAEPTPNLGVAEPERSRPPREAPSDVQPPTSNRPESPLPAAEGTRHVPAQVARAVWARDAGRCAFIGATGRRCNSTKRLQLHHLQAWARGGAATVDNLALRCRIHNRYEAELDFGLEHMAQYRRGSEALTREAEPLRPPT